MKRQDTALRSIAVLFAAALAPWAVAAADVLEGPTLTMDPNGLTPLAGVIELVTDEPVQARLTIHDGATSRTARFPIANTQHELPVLGLKPDRSYTIDVEIVPGGHVGSVVASTPPLPDDYPTFEVTASRPLAMEPGYTLIDCMRRGAADDRPRYTTIVDYAGDIVWYTPQCITAARMLPNGLLYYRSGNNRAVSDLLGNIDLMPLQDPGLRLHHDLLRTPHGTWLTLTRRTIPVAQFPSSETDPNAPLQPAMLRDDSVVEFLPDGSLRSEWPHYGMIDPLRIGYDSLNNTPDGLDWTHSNALNYRYEEDAILVSVRHQDAVIQFSRRTGELQWVLGTHDNWAGAYQPYLLNPIGTPFRWQFHQHAPMWTEDGNILLFDNGNHRASPFDGTDPLTAEDNFSRAVEFEVDGAAMEVRQVWEYGENTDESLFSFFISDADSQPKTGNRLLTFGGVSHVDGVPSVDLGLGTVHARVIEVSGDAEPNRLFELRIYDAGGRISVYRSARIPDLYPQRFFIPPNGVGDTVRIDADADPPVLRWDVPPASSSFQTAEYYIVYGSTAPNSGYSMLDSTAETWLEYDDQGPLTYFRVVAANLAGTSGDEPPP